MRAYAESLENPLRAVRRTLVLLQNCVTRFAAQCTDAQRNASRSAQADVARLDTLKLLNVSGAKTHRPDFDDFESFEQLLETETVDLLRVNALFEHQSFAVFGAALRTCAPDSADEYRSGLAGVRDMDLQNFEALPADDYAIALRGIETEEARISAQMRAWPAGECVRARAIGELVTMLLQHWKLDHWPPGDGASVSDLARERTTVFLMNVAALLERTVSPSSAGQVLPH